MDLTAKREAALKLMQSKGIWKVSQSPLMLRALWRSGIDCPPPQMAAFGMCALVFGCYFGIAMWMFYFLGLGKFSVEGAVVGSVLAGTLFGVLMAWYFWHLRRKHNIPLWRDFKPAE